MHNNTDGRILISNLNQEMILASMLFNLLYEKGRFLAQNRFRSVHVVLESRLSSHKEDGLRILI